MEDNNIREQYSISAFVLGIISIVTTMFYYITIPSGVLAIIFGIKEYKYSKSKLAIAGFVMGIVGLSLSLLIDLIYALIILNVFYIR